MNPAEAAGGPRIHAGTAQTTRTGRYAWCGVAPASARRLWFALHGYGQLAERFLRPFAEIVPADGAHLQRVGATWMTREARTDDIADALAWLSVLQRTVLDAVDREGPPPTIGVLAFSQGVATAMRWLATGTVQPHACVFWAGAPAPELDADALRDATRHATVSLVAGDADPLINGEARDAALAAVRRWAPEARLLRFPGAHQLDAELLARCLQELPVAAAT
jgi:dienelactone hydrolase